MQVAAWLYQKLGYKAEARVEAGEWHHLSRQEGPSQDVEGRLLAVWGSGTPLLVL